MSKTNGNTETDLTKAQVLHEAFVGTDQHEPDPVLAECVVAVESATTQFFGSTWDRGEATERAVAHATSKYGASARAIVEELAQCAGVSRSLLDNERTAVKRLAVLADHGMLQVTLQSIRSAMTAGTFAQSGACAAINANPQAFVDAFNSYDDPTDTIGRVRSAAANVPREERKSPKSKSDDKGTEPTEPTEPTASTETSVDMPTDTIVSGGKLPAADLVVRGDAVKASAEADPMAMVDAFVDGWLSNQTDEVVQHLRAKVNAMMADRRKAEPVSV